MQTSLASAETSLQRIASTLEAKLCESTTIYASTASRLESIRRAAESVMLLANDLLSKVGKGDPRFDGRSPVCGSFEDYAKRIAEEAALRTLAMAGASAGPIVNVQTMNVGEASKVHEDAEVVEVVVEDERPKRTSKSFLRKFKSVVSSTAKRMAMSSDAKARECASILDAIFKARFDRRNDPRSIHRFDCREMRNYVAAIVIDYASAVDAGDGDSYASRIGDWVSEVECGTVRFTLPASANKVFFTIAKPDKCSDFATVTESSLAIARSIWASLWQGGFYEFPLILDEPLSSLPTSTFDWFDANALSGSSRPKLDDGFESEFRIVAEELGSHVFADDLDSIHALWDEYRMSTVRPDYAHCQDLLIDGNEAYGKVYGDFAGDMAKASMRAFSAVGLAFGIEYLEASYRIGYGKARESMPADVRGLSIEDVPISGLDAIGIYEDYVGVMEDVR